MIILLYALSYYYKSLTGQAQEATPNLMIEFLSLCVIILGAFIILFYILRISIKSVKYSNSQVRFEGKLGTFIGKMLLGFFLSMITLSIYVAWFIKDVTKFVVNSSSINDSNFEFQGKGSKLFLILLLSVYLPFPIILLATFMLEYIITINQTYSFIYSLIYQGVELIILIPYTYLAYKWMINIKFKDYQIKWQTEFGASCVKILVEMLLIMVTFGIYMPLGYLKLYKYFADKTEAESSDKTLRFGYELDKKSDFLFIWGQMLLTIITAGIYFPWAYSKIGKRILEKTYIENNAA